MGSAEADSQNISNSTCYQIDQKESFKILARLQAMAWSLDRDQVEPWPTSHRCCAKALQCDAHVSSNVIQCHPMFHPMSSHVIQCFIQCFIQCHPMFHTGIRSDASSDAPWRGIREWDAASRSLRRITGGLSYVTACLVALTRIGAIHISPPLYSNLFPHWCLLLFCPSVPRGALHHLICHNMPELEI